jgi:predicted glycosyltransferase
MAASDRNAPVRVALFSHDAYGIGHLQRCVHIIRSLAERAPRAALLLVTGSPSIQRLRTLPPTADYVKVPTLVTSGAPNTRPPMLNVGLAELSALRRGIIEQTLVRFSPDVLLVDNFPLGSRLELLPSLQALRGRGTRLVLGLRDIADPPERLKTDWARDGLYDILERYYDRILVYGVRDVLDIAAAYALPSQVAKRVRYCGYVTRRNLPARSPAEVRRALGMRGPLVLATVGGGGDGFPLLRTFLQALPRIPRVAAMVVTGELMSAMDRSELHRLVDGHPRVLMQEYVDDLPSFLAAADAVVAMGGYNTSAEILAVRAKAIVVPRTWKSGEHATRLSTKADEEQLFRARVLARLGFVECIEPGALTPKRLAERITALLSRPRPQRRRIMKVDGADRVAEQLLAMARGREHP